MTLTNNQWNSIINAEDSLIIPKKGMTACFAISYRISKKLEIETGIQYSNKGYQTISMLTMYDITKPPENAQNIMNFSYFDIPLKANLSLLDKRFQFLIGAGVTLNVHSKTSATTVPDNPTQEFYIQTYVSDYPYNKINITPTVNIGIKYNLSEIVSLRAEPTFRYSILNIDKKSYKATYLWSAGLNLGFYIKII